MADVTPLEAMGSGKCVLTWGSNTYHGITNWERLGSADSQTVKASSTAGTKTYRFGGGTEVTIAVDILVGAGDATTPVALKEGAEQAICTLHPEGDVAGNLEIIFTDGGQILSNRMGGNQNQPNIMSITIGAIGADSMADAT